MENDWTVFIINPPAEHNMSQQMQKERLLIDLIKPCIENIESVVDLRTFHFLFEPNGLHFRIRAERPEDLVQINDIVRRHLDNFQEISFLLSSYTGEESAFGIEGWKHVQKFFELGSRISLMFYDTIKQLRINPNNTDDILSNCNISTRDNQVGQFNDSKLVHCFLNQMGYNVIQETEYCLRRFQGQIEVLRRHLPEIFTQTKQKWVDLLTKVKDQVERIDA